MLNDLELNLKYKEDYDFEKDKEYSYELYVTRNNETVVFDLQDSVEYQFANDDNVKKSAFMDAFSCAAAYKTTPDKDEFIESIMIGNDIKELEIVYDKCKLASENIDKLFTKEELKILDEELNQFISKEIEDWVEDMEI